MLRKLQIFYVLAALIVSSRDGVCRATELVLATGGKACYKVVAGESCPFAAEELARYLEQMTGATFTISNAGSFKPSKASGTKPVAPAILVCGANEAASLANWKLATMKPEEWGIFVHGDDIVLAGGDRRGVTYAVYNFLERLGCRWIAPAYPFYEGRDSHIPHTSHLTYIHKGDMTDRPEMAWRKFYVEEGKTHTEESLRQLIDWMPKLGFNTLVIPMNYQGSGRVLWDNWRKVLTPELQRRGIIIEVGGHGYENFLNAGMENGELYMRHPEWFGMDGQGERSKNKRMVFCTSNPGAVHYLFANVVAYLRAHPEINVFDFWPPDMEQWCACPMCAPISPQQRHVQLVNALAQMLSDSLPDVTLECLAYSHYLYPPSGVTLDKRVLLDFCAEKQNFERQTWEEGNEYYDRALHGWLETFQGRISVYTYWRKYKWLSLPNIFPHYMQAELRYYRRLGLSGVSIYSEPGDWFTYGPNYYILGHLAQHPDADVDSLMDEYTEQLFGSAHLLACEIYSLFEQTVRSGCRFPDVQPKPLQYYDSCTARVDRELTSVAAAISHYTIGAPVPAADSVTVSHLRRLEGLLRYVRLSIEEQRELVAGNRTTDYKPTEKMRALFDQYSGMGLFVR